MYIEFSFYSSDSKSIALHRTSQRRSPRFLRGWSHLPEPGDLAGSGTGRADWWHRHVPQRPAGGQTNCYRYLRFASIPLAIVVLWGCRSQSTLRMVRPLAFASGGCTSHTFPAQYPCSSVETTPINGSAPYSSQRNVTVADNSGINAIATGSDHLRSIVSISKILLLYFHRNQTTAKGMIWVKLSLIQIGHTEQHNKHTSLWETNSYVMREKSTVLSR